MHIMMAIDLIWVLFVMVSLRLNAKRDLLLILTVICMFQASITSMVFGADPLRFLHQLFFFIIYPLLLAHTFAQYEKSSMITMTVIAGLSLAGLNLAVLPLELMLRGGLENISKLQFSGRAYEIIGALILTLTIANIQPQARNGIIYASLVISSVISFSRGAIAITLLILSSTAGRQFKLLLSQSGVVFGLFLSPAIIWVLTSPVAERVRFFWIARMNFVSNENFSDNLVNFLSGFGRIDIWKIASSHISEYPLFGTGVATTAKYISDYTSGMFSFSGYHNLSLTIIAERGVLIGSLFVILLIFNLQRLIYGGYLKSFIFFTFFLLFSHTTGCEYVIISSSVRNPNILFFIFVLFLILTHQKAPSSV